jgi:hypothetical protein
LPGFIAIRIPQIECDGAFIEFDQYKRLIEVYAGSIARPKLNNRRQRSRHGLIKPLTRAIVSRFGVERSKDFPSPSQPHRSG